VVNAAAFALGFRGLLFESVSTIFALAAWSKASSSGTESEFAVVLVTGSAHLRFFGLIPQSEGNKAEDDGPLELRKVCRLKSKSKTTRLFQIASRVDLGIWVGFGHKMPSQIPIKTSPNPHQNRYSDRPYFLLFTGLHQDSVKA
jgi:hypothetical protein